MERHVISRIFHPIGQGAFYAELHSGFNIVYDCGNWKKTTLSGNVVGQSFTADDVIDILFISHFDWDQRLNKTGMFVLNKTVIFLDHHKANHDRY